MLRAKLVLVIACAVALSGCIESCDTDARFVRTCATTCGARGVLAVLPETGTPVCICQTGSVPEAAR